MADKKLQPNEEIPARIMEQFAQLIASLTQGRGFVLVITPVDASLPVQYVSNVSRNDAHMVLETMCEKWRNKN